MGKTNLFVYGTLKTGERSNAKLAGEQFIRPAETVAQYRLFDFGSFPGLVHVGEGGVAVQGELWSVDDELLKKLDEYEHVPEMFVRAEILVQHCFEPVQAYLYNCTLLVSAPWSDRWPRPA